MQRFGVDVRPPHRLRPGPRRPARPRSRGRWPSATSGTTPRRRCSRWPSPTAGTGPGRRTPCRSRSASRRTRLPRLSSFGDLPDRAGRADLAAQRRIRLAVADARHEHRRPEPSSPASMKVGCRALFGHTFMHSPQRMQRSRNCFSSTAPGGRMQARMPFDLRARRRPQERDQHGAGGDAGDQLAAAALSGFTTACRGRGRSGT